MSEIFVMAIVAELICICIAVHYLFKIRVTRNRFRIFEVRDRFIRLAASKDLKTDDDTYLFFMDYLNFLINNTQQIHMLGIIKGIKHLKKNDLKGQVENIDKIVKEVNENKNEKVEEAVAEFFSAILTILWENSLFVKLFVYSKKILGGPRIKKLGEKPEVLMYQEYSQINAQLKA